MMLGSCRRGDGPALGQRVRSMRGAVANRLRFTKHVWRPRERRGADPQSAISGPELKPARATGSVLPPRHLLLDFSTISCGKCSLCVFGFGASVPVFAAAKRYEVATIAHRNRRFDSAAHRCAAGRAVSLYAAPAAVPAGASPHCSLCTARIRACTACIRACTACIRVDGLHWSLHRCSQPQKLSTWC